MIYLWKKVLEMFANDKSYGKVSDRCLYASKYRGTTHRILNLKINVPNEFPGVSYNNSNYDYHFIIKELANDFER